MSKKVTVILDLRPIAVPLIEREGALLVEGTRVPLDTIVRAFERGATPEEIAQQYPVELADVYSVISFYLQNQNQVKAYLQRREADAEQIRLDNQARSPSTGLRERLLARRPAS